MLHHTLGSEITVIMFYISPFLSVWRHLPRTRDAAPLCWRNERHNAISFYHVEFCIYWYSSDKANAVRWPVLVLYVCSLVVYSYTYTFVNVHLKARCIQFFCAYLENRSDDYAVDFFTNRFLRFFSYFAVFDDLPGKKRHTTLD